MQAFRNPSQEVARGWSREEKEQEALGEGEGANLFHSVAGKFWSVKDANPAEIFLQAFVFLFFIWKEESGAWGSLIIIFKGSVLFISSALDAL